jgi:hypothetical protein
VGDRGQELVLGAARLLGRPVEPRVVDRLGRPAGQVFGERQVGRRVTPSRVHRAEGDGAQDPTTGRQRHDHDRPEPQRAKRLAVPVVGYQAGQDLVVDFGNELRLPGTQHAGERVGRPRLAGGMRRKGRRGLELRGLNVRGRQPADAVVRFEHVHRAEVGEPRDHQARHLRQRRLVVQRRGEHAAGLGQEGRPPLGGFRLPAPALRFLEQPRVLEGDAGLIGEDLGQADLLGTELPPRLVGDQEHADDAVLDDHRHRQRRPRVARLQVRAQLRRQRDPRVPQHVGTGHRAALASREPRRTGALRQAHTRAEAGVPRAGQHRQPAGFREVQHGGGPGSEQPARAVGDPPRDQLAVERLGEQTAEVGEGLRRAERKAVAHEGIKLAKGLPRWHTK